MKDPANTPDDLPTRRPDTHNADDARADEWMRAAAQNEPAPFGCLVRAYQGRVWAFVYPMTGGDYAQAQDIAQETFVRLWQARQAYTPHGEAALLAYLFQTARRLCIDHARRKAARPPQIQTDAWGTIAAPAETLPPAQAQARSLADALAQAVADLPEDARAVWVLRETEGWTYRQIAETLQIPMGTVASRRHSALMTLRAQLAPWLED